MDLSPRWITPQINGPIMSLSFGRKVIDLLGSGARLASEDHTCA